MKDNVENRNRLKSLLIDPRENLNTEIRNWIDLKNNKEHKEKFIKSLLAIANTGGGFIIIGFTEENGIMIPAPQRPDNFNGYTQDIINDIADRYANPPIHCDVYYVPDPNGVIYPIISIPGGHRVPIMFKNGSIENKIFTANDIVIRRPGPASEKPRHPQEWLELIERCISARQNELLDQTRNRLNLFTSQPTNLNADISGKPIQEETKFNEWISTCLNRWKNLIQPLSQNDARRFPLGYYWIAYKLNGKIRPLNNIEFIDLLKQAVPHHTGWPPFWLPNKETIKYYINDDDNIECWIGRDKKREYDNPAHCDFWSISPDGYAFLIRGFMEDDPEIAKEYNIKEGQTFNVTTPIWRVGEALVHLEKLATKLLVEKSAGSTFKVKYYGLSGRQLRDLDNKAIIQHYISQQNQIILENKIENIQNISENLPEITYSLLKPLYELFGLYQLPKSLVQHELTKLRSNRF